MRKIRDLRSKMNMSQKEFGEKIGRSASTISHWESGRHTPTREAQKEINKLAERQELDPPFKNTQVGALIGKLGWSQRELGKRIGVTQNTVCNWVNGTKEPVLKNKQRINELAQKHGLKFPFPGKGTCPLPLQNIKEEAAKTQIKDGLQKMGVTLEEFKEAMGPARLIVREFQLDMEDILNKMEEK